MKNAAIARRTEQATNGALPWDVLSDSVLSLFPDDLPPPPIRLCHGITIVDRELYLPALQADVRRAEESARDRYGALRAEMETVLILAGR